MTRLSGVLLWAFVLALTACSEPEEGGSELGAIETMREPPEGFEQAQPGMSVTLPQDLGAHPRYRLEWWYLTANLHSESGEQFGVQWTLFRTGVKPGPYTAQAQDWPLDEIWLAHAALSQPENHQFAARSARGGTGQAGVTAQPFSAWMDDWALREQADHWLLSVKADDFSYRLKLNPGEQPVFNGVQGFSAKSAGGGGSMYFSFPMPQITGEVTVQDRTIPVQGQGWFDREWSSQYLKADQQGWDWMALHLDDGRRIMVFRVRGAEDFYAGTLVAADGTARSLNPSEFSLQPQTFRDSRFGSVPVNWQLTIPAEGIALEIASWPGDFWNPGSLRYWEGPVRVSGSASGEGYLEMTGYGNRAD